MGRGRGKRIAGLRVIAHTAVSATCTKLTGALGSFEQLTSDSCLQDVVDDYFIASVSIVGPDSGTRLSNG